MNKYGANKVTTRGITFQSKMESDYYLHLLELQKQGEIDAITLQPRYVLQDKFEKNGVKHRRIEYVADFETVTPDGYFTTIDVKGFVTEAAKLKFKLFEKVYEDRVLKLVTYVKKYGGWIELDELKKKRKANKAVG